MSGSMTLVLAAGQVTQHPILAGGDTGVTNIGPQVRADGQVHLYLTRPKGRVPMRLLGV